MTHSLNSSLILCATPRLAANLRRLYQREQVQQGRSQWQPLNALPLVVWLNQLIDDAVMSGEIEVAHMPAGELNTVQESLLWERAIKDSLKANDAKEFFDISSLAVAAMEANRLVTEWNLHLNSDEATAETKAFLVWRQRFQVLCKKTGHLEAVRYSNWRIEVLKQGAGKLSGHIEFAGFDRTHPQLKKLQEALIARGVCVTNKLLTFDEPQSSEHVVLSDREAECRAAVLWAKTQLQENKSAHIAIVVPELAALRAKLSGLLDDVLHPETARPAFIESARCFDFSLGVPLNTQPVIATALNLLQLAWQHGNLSQHQVANLLHSPYWSDDLTEADSKALFDARMRRDLPMSFKVNRLRHYIHKVTADDEGIAIPITMKALDALFDYAQAQNVKQPPSTWALIFTAALKHAQWPGKRSLSTVESQAVKLFERVIGELGGLDALLANLSVSQAMLQLTKLCQAKLSQIESKQIPRLQILGLLESVAAPLDAMWVMGMNDHLWPPVARPNALIPANLQRLAQTPNSSSEEQDAFANAIHARLIKSARHIIFSSAYQEGDRELRPSPLMHEIPLSTTQWPLAKTLAEQLVQGAPSDVIDKPWQWLDDHQAPIVEEGGHVSGGTGLIKAQAICPAWAFYQYRLHAKALKAPMDGLDAMERGNLVHEVLEAFWEGRDSNYLANLSDADISFVLEKIAQDVLTLFNQIHDQAFSDLFLQLEKERLIKLVKAWLLDVEKRRPMGFKVQAVERKQTIPIENILITLAVDRIDRLEDDRLLVMDYKTGSNINFKNWAEPNITEPQLPIYAAFLMGDEEIAAVCFAKVVTDKPEFSGVVANQEVVQGATVFDETKGRHLFDVSRFPDWPSIIAHWRSSLIATAQSIHIGEAAVRFELEKQLAYCEVLPLLRLAERQLQFEYRSLHPMVSDGEGEA